MPASYLKIGGELLADALLSKVEVDEELNRHSWCRIECRQTADRRFPFEQALGKPVEVMAVDQQGAAHLLFTGFVFDSELEYEIYGSYTVRIVAVSTSYKLSVSAEETYYRKQTLPGVGAAIAARSGVPVDVRPPAGPPKNYVQWGECDFDFLVRLADDAQAWVRPTAEGVEVRRAFADGPAIEWRADDGQGLTEFEVTGRLGQAAFGGTHYDARSMRSETIRGARRAPESFGSSGRMSAAVATQSAARLPDGFVHMDGRAATAAEFRARLERESVRSVGSGTVCRGQSRNEQVRAGATVEVTGAIDARGKYGVTRVAHRWTKQGYTNEFWCTPWKDYIGPAAPGPRPVRGVVSARVVDQNDPRKMGRLKVQYDWQEQGETGWARMAAPHAGGDRGFLFLPEIGDEVLVAFEHGDPERPIVLGSLWNGVDRAPRTEFWGGDIEPNDVKRIVTKSGHRIQLVDTDGKEALVIATPSKLKVAMLEKTDETDRPMLLVHSEDGDIVVSAPKGRIHVQAAFFSREAGAGGGSAPGSTEHGAPRRDGAAAAPPLSPAAGGAGQAAISKAVAAGAHANASPSAKKAAIAPKPSSPEPVKAAKAVPPAIHPRGSGASPGIVPPGASKPAAKSTLCKHQGLKVSCSHGRAPGMLASGFGLQVLGKDAISATTEQLLPACGNHKAFLSVTPVPPGPRVTPTSYSYPSQPVPVSLKDDFWYTLWPARPHVTTARINAASCNGTSSSVLIEIYPDIQWEAGISFALGVTEAFSEAKNRHGNVSASKIREEDTASATLEAHAQVTIDGVTRSMKAEVEESLKQVHRIAKDFDALTRGVSKILKKVGGVEIGIDLPNVAFTGSWGWKEDPATCRCGYYYGIEFSADPLLGVRGTVDVVDLLLREVPPVAELNDFLRKHETGGLSIPFTVAGTIGGALSGEKNVTEDKWELDGSIAGELTFTLEGKAKFEPHASVHIWHVSAGGHGGGGVSATATSGVKATIKGGIASGEGVYVEGVVGFNGIEIKTAAWVGAGFEVRWGEHEAGAGATLESSKEYTVVEPKENWLDSGKYYFLRQ